MDLGPHRSQLHWLTDQNSLTWDVEVGMRSLVWGKTFLKPKALNKHLLLGVTGTVIRQRQVKLACSP